MNAKNEGGGIKMIFFVKVEVERVPTQPIEINWRH